MNNAVEILISLVVVVALTLLLSRTLKLSSKSERKPHKLSDWNAQDQGIDPTLDSESDR
jgi:NADH:ubiquinone oxidoreductase subunit 3 (subunit A)